MLDELEVEVTADGKGVVTMPTDYRTKRQKGDDYPLAAASSLKKGWAEQADDFADYLTGMTPEQASMLETDKDGKAVDADLLSGCTIRVDKYRDAVAKACTNASALGAAKGDRVSLGVEAENASSDITATDDKDVNAEVDLTVVALTLDADGRVTSAIGDMAEPALTIAADGGVTAPDTVRSKLELGDSYGMRNASARSGTSTARAIAATSRARLRKRWRTSLPTARTPTSRPSAPSPSTPCKRPQGMRLRMRHYKLNGKSDRHREVAVFFLSFVQIHRKPYRKGAVCGQNAKKSVFLLQNGAKRAIL